MVSCEHYQSKVNKIMKQTTCQNEIASEEAEIDLIKIFSLLWKNKGVIFVITLICSGASVLYAFSLPDIYTAEATIMPVDSSGKSTGGGLGSLGGLASLAGVSAHHKGGYKTANLAVMKSRLFIMNFIKDNNILPTLFPQKWDNKKKTWVLKSGNKKPTLQAGYKKFSNELLSINEDKITGLVRVKVQWTDPELASIWANNIIKEINQFLKKKAIEESRQSIIYLKEQVKITREVGIQELLYKLIEKELRTTTLASVRHDYAFKVIDPALVPERKSKPRRLLICIYGALFGIMISFVLVFTMRRMLNFNKKSF